MTTMRAQSTPLEVQPERSDRMTYTHRQLIGGLGLALPALIWLIQAVRPINPAQRWALLPTISSYYWTGAGAIYVGTLLLMAAFMFTYRGFAGRANKLERLAARVAALAATVAVFFPAGAPPSLRAPAWWTPLTGDIHSVAGTTLYATFAFMALFVFPRPASGQVARPALNLLYIATGLVICACLVWCAVNALRQEAFVLPQIIGLESFAVCWLLKGYTEVGGRPTAGR